MSTLRKSYNVPSILVPIFSNRYHPNMFLAIDQEERIFFVAEMGCVEVGRSWEEAFTTIDVIDYTACGEAILSRLGDTTHDYKYLYV